MGESQISQAGPEGVPDRRETFELARVEELRLLDLQRTQLDNLRTRTAQYLAFVGSASAFLVGSGLRSADRSQWFYVVAIAATIASATTLVAAYAQFANFDLRHYFEKSKRELQWSWGLVNSGHALEFATSEVPAVSAEDLARRLAERYQNARKRNDAPLLIAQTLFRWFLVAGSAQIVLWSIVVWVWGR